MNMPLAPTWPDIAIQLVLADPPLELLRLIDHDFPIKSFELTTDSGR